MATESTGDWYDVLDDPVAAVDALVEDLSVGAASDVLRVLHDHKDPVERLMSLYALKQTLEPLESPASDEVVSPWEQARATAGHPMAVTPSDIILSSWARRAAGTLVSATGAFTAAVCAFQGVRMMGAGIDPVGTGPEYIQGMVVGGLMFLGGTALRSGN